MASSPAKPWNVHTTGSNGVTMFTRHQAQTFARQLLQSETYREWIEDRIKTKTLQTPVEIMLWHYAFGKPIEQVEMRVTQGVEDLSQLSLEELYQRAQQYAAELEEAKALAEAIPGEVLQGPWENTTL